MTTASAVRGPFRFGAAALHLLDWLRTTPRGQPIVPTSVLGGLRFGLLLTFLLSGVAAGLPVLAFASSEAAALRLAGAVGLLGLAAWFSWGYRHQRLPTVGLVFEVPILTLVIVAGGGLGSAPGLLFPALMFRVSHSSLSGYLGAVVGAGCAYLAVGSVWSALGESAARIVASPSPSDLIGFPAVGTLLFGFCVSLTRYERAALRERVIAHASAALMAATSRVQVCAATFDAVRALLSEAAVGRISLSVSQPGAETLEVVAADGHQAAAIHGTTVDLSRIPPGLRFTTATTQISLNTAARADLELTLGFPPLPGIVTFTPLRARGEPIGVLVVESPCRLPNEGSDGLTTLAGEAALALEGIRLMEDLRRDIAERQALEAELAHRAFHDALTDLPNRALLIDRLDQALARTARGGRRPALIFIDLDDFKLVNDSLGHLLGDELLVEVAQRLCCAVRPGDTAARIGGDEFVILLDVSDAADALGVAERILASFQPPVLLGNVQVPVRASIGIALSRAEQTFADDLLREADIAMYAAKATGKHRYAVFDATMSLDSHTFEASTHAA